MKYRIYKIRQGYSVFLHLLFKDVEKEHQDHDVDLLSLLLRSHNGDFFLILKFESWPQPQFSKTNVLQM